jgi:hypothetical protein
VELFLPVHTGLNLTGTDGLYNSGHAGEEVILFLGGFDTVVEPARNLSQSFLKGLFGALGHLVAHQDAQLVQFLPLPIESQECSNLKIPGGDIECASNVCPVMKIMSNFPIIVTVINNEQGAAMLAWLSHWSSPSVQNTPKFLIPSTPYYLFALIITVVRVIQDKFQLRL